MGPIKFTEIKFKQDLVNVLYKNRTKTSKINIKYNIY